MSAHQVAVNSRALIAAADRLSEVGYDGDAYRFVESLVLSVLADGYARIEPVPPLRPDRADLDGDGYREFVEAREALANRQKEHH